MSNIMPSNLPTKMKWSNPERYKHKILLKKTPTAPVALHLLKKLNIA